jgi:ketosteroid isomerase-like protein
MLQILKTVQDIYEAMEHGNIGKIISALDEDFTVYLAKSLGGRYQGREGILEVVSKLCSSSSAFKKITTSFFVNDTNVIVTGKIVFTEKGGIVTATSFVDVWTTENGQIKGVELFYLDTDAILVFLKE